jgi:hypothetical protein
VILGTRTLNPNELTARVCHLQTPPFLQCCKDIAGHPERYLYNTFKVSALIIVIFPSRAVRDRMLATWTFFTICILLLASWLDSSDVNRTLTVSFGSLGKESKMAHLDQFILFGDSLFQHSSDQARGFGMHSALQAGKEALSRF